MIVKLNGVRQHDSLRLEFPESGIIMIQGPSGAGKSTILDAVDEGLYGEGDDIATWGSTKSQIELEFNRPVPLKVDRRRGPKTLTVLFEGVEYKDEAAQAIINRIFGTAHEFRAARYIRQDFDESLLSLGPADQLRFIQKLGEDPEKIRESIQSQIRLREIELVVAEDAVAPARLEAERALKAHQAIVTKEPTTEVPVEQLVEYVKEFKENERLITESYKKELALSKALKNPAYELMDSIDRLEAESNAVIVQNTAEITATQYRIARSNQLLEASEGVADLEAKREALVNKGKRLNTLSQIKYLSDHVAKTYHVAAGTKASTVLANRLDQLQKEQETASTREAQAATKLSELLGLSRALPCPHCAGPLAIMDQKIVKSVGKPDGYDHLVLAAETKLRAVKEANKQGAAEIHEIRLIQRQAADLVASLLPDTVPEAADVREVESQIKAVDDKLHWMDMEIVTVRMGQKNIDRLVEKNKQLVGSVEKNKEIVERELANGLKPKAELNAERAAQQSNHFALLNQNDILKRHNDAYRQYEHEVALVAAEQRRANDLLLIAGERARTLKAAQEALSVAQARYAAAKRLKELSDAAAVEAIELIIDQINEYAAQAIDKMFPNDGTVVKIKNLTQTKTSDKAKLSLEILHKGKAPKKLSSLSGGERSRIKLAFQLALAEIYKSTILMIDEGFAGLSADDKKECLEVLRELSGDRLVLVIEHGAPESFFDQVIQVS